MVFPLMPKDGLDNMALSIVEDLITHQFDVEYDESGTIGRRYARADEIGVPISVTVDYASKKDKSVTLRDRDSRSQVRTDRKSIAELAHEFLMGKMQFSQLGQPVVAKAEE